MSTRKTRAGSRTAPASRDEGDILANARAHAQRAKDIADMAGYPGESILKEGLMENALAISGFRTLLTTTNEGSEIHKTVLEELRESVDSGYKLAGNVLSTTELPAHGEVASLAKKMERMSLTPPPSTISISTDTPEDAAIVAKIIGSIVTKPCGLRTFADYAGVKEFQQFFNTIAIDRYRYPNFEQEHPNTESILLFGPPGTGKTLLAEAVAAELAPFGATFISISAADIKGRFVGESEKSIKYLFQVAREATKGRNGKYGERPVVILMDEVDGLIEESTGGGGGVGTGLLSQFNAEIAGANVNNKGLIVIAVTNYPEKIPPAAFQRFTHKIFIGLPSLDDLRELLMKKLKKIGWDRVNFYDPILPRWLQEIDWERVQFITTFLGITSNSSREQQRWSFPGQFETEQDEDPDTGALRSSPSIFFKIADANDVRDKAQIAVVRVGAPFFNVKPGLAPAEAVPWDVVDYMAWYLWSRYYAPREVDGIFSTMLLRAEQRSVFFATQNPISQSKVYYQKWLLQKLFVDKLVQEGNRCVTKRVGPRYAAIPLWYTTVSEKIGDKPEDEQKLEQAFFQRFADGSAIKFGEAWGYRRLTSANGSVATRLEPKFNLKDKSNESRVIVTRTQINDATPVSQELLKGAAPRIIRKVFLERKQTKDVAVPSGATMENPPFIPTEKWLPGSDEQLNPDNFPKILGISQIVLNDFKDSVAKIRSIAIRNVDQMIRYAREFGYSVKGGADIEQLERQAALMEKIPETSRYSEIWRQFVEAIQSAGGV